MNQLDEDLEEYENHDPDNCDDPFCPICNDEAEWLDDDEDLEVDDDFDL